MPATSTRSRPRNRLVGGRARKPTTSASKARSRPLTSKRSCRAVTRRPGPCSVRRSSTGSRSTARSSGRSPATTPPSRHRNRSRSGGDSPATAACSTPTTSAVGAVLAHLERYGCTTRVRVNGTRSFPDANGLTMAVFQQSTSREDDPQLHTHAVVSSKVQAPNGRWYALDAHYLKHNQHAARQPLPVGAPGRAHPPLRRRLGPDRQRPGRDRRASPTSCSKRSPSEPSRSRTSEVVLLDAFREREGRDPTRREAAAIEREAAAGLPAGQERAPPRPGPGPVAGRGRRTRLDPRAPRRATSPGRAHSRPVLPDRRRHPRHDHRRALHLAARRRHRCHRRGHTCRSPASTAPPGPGPSNTPPIRCSTPTSTSTPPPPVPPEHPTAARSGSIPTCRTCPTSGSWPRRNASSPGPSPRRTPNRPPRPPSTSLVSTRSRPTPPEPSPATTRSSSSSGPAGTGKTTTLGAAGTDLARPAPAGVRRRPDGQGRPRPRSRDRASRPTPSPSSSTNGTDPTGPAPATACPRPARPSSSTRASMVGTNALDRLVGLAQSQQWRLVLVGDPRQLQAVGRGGMFDELCRTGRPHHLQHVHRFAHRWEADATLALRSRTPQRPRRLLRPSPRDRRRPRRPHSTGSPRPGSTTTSASTRSPSPPRPTHTSTRSTPPSRPAGATLGHLDPDCAVAIGGGETAGPGDLVVTRRNDRTLRTDHGEPVRNRERWRVDTVHADGTLTVSRRSGTRHRSTLPADYVRQHVRLGYAATAHGHQGDTVDRSYTLVTPATSHRALYVGATRGRQSNRLARRHRGARSRRRPRHPRTRPDQRPRRHPRGCTPTGPRRTRARRPTASPRPARRSGASRHPSRRRRTTVRDRSRRTPLRPVRGEL